MSTAPKTKTSTFKFKSNPFNFSLRKKLSTTNLKLNAINISSSAATDCITQEISPNPIKFEYDSSGPVSEASYSSDTDQLPTWKKLNSQSPASEIPTNWHDWNEAYRTGRIDFEDPPNPPDCLQESSYQYSNGSYLAPRPDNERFRQKALDATGILELKKEIPLNPMIPVSRKRESNPTLDAICLRAQKTFGGGFAGVNMIDREYVVFSANVGFDGVEGNPRDATVCAHTLLAAATNGAELTVILDLKRDWRFKDSPNHEGFYASYPIMSEPSFGDKSATPYPIGLMCVMDPLPRKSFSTKERKSLEILAREAGAEIARSTQRRRSQIEDERIEKHDEWSHASIAYSIETLATSDGESSRNNSVTSIPPAYSAYSPQPLITNVYQCPVFPRRRATRAGISAPLSESIPPNLRKIFDLATCLLAETLGFDYVYFLSIDLNPLTPASQALSLISSYNLPLPPPLFDFQMHLEPLHTSNTLLYNNPDENDSVEGHFATGLLLKVGVASKNGFVSGNGFILAGFSEDKKKVLNHMDFLFFSNFASDLSKHIGKI